MSAFGQRTRQIKKKTGIPLRRLYGDAHLRQDRKSDSVCVETPMDNGDALYDLRDVYRLLTAPDQALTIDDMKLVYSNIGHESQSCVECGVTQSPPVFNSERSALSEFSQIIHSFCVPAQVFCDAFQSGPKYGIRSDMKFVLFGYMTVEMRRVTLRTAG